MLLSVPWRCRGCALTEFKELRDSVWDRAWEGGLSSAELLVLLRLVEHMPTPYPNLKTLERWTRLDERTIRRALRKLEDEKIIRTQRNPGRGNQYQFLDEAGAPIVIRRIGPRPRTQRPHPPDTMTAGADTVTGPTTQTPDTMTAEADPDLKQESKREDEAGARVRQRAKLESGPLENPGSQPVLRYRFDPKWRPKPEHRARGLEIGLTDDQILELSELARRKPRKHGFFNEDDEFHRDMIWERRERETQQLIIQRKASNGKEFELPGNDRKLIR
jgi:hypothetical protein